MKCFEFEIPGKLVWKFETIEEAVDASLRLMVNSVDFAFIHQLNSQDDREGILVHLERNGSICPNCLEKGTMINFRSDLEKYQNVSFCRECKQIISGQKLKRRT
ncbi:hypothetical protein EH221_02600 [bacterium]|nr:MAG: hypothetical protein EH221_02600 [bacterium]